MSKLFSFTQSIAMDLGTANTVIMQDNQVVVDEPSVVAIRVADDSTLAVGKKADAMIDRPVDRIRAIRPLKDGVISDYKACEKMIRGLIKMMPKKSRINLFKRKGPQDAVTRNLQSSKNVYTHPCSFWSQSEICSPTPN